MPNVIEKGRYRVRIAASEQDLRRAQVLRHRAFGGLGAGGQDSDAHDAHCVHFLVEDMGTGGAVCCFRLLPLADGRDIGRSYSAQFYGLRALGAYDRPMIELGRFCVDPAYRDPDIIRIAWASLTRYVDAHGIRMMFGCSSFPGTDTEIYRDAFALLRDRHLGPQCWLPGVKAPVIFPFAQQLQTRRPDLRLAQLRMPPLLRTYLLMGGWVSDHAVVDRQMNTLHVFTGVEIGAIPDIRKRLLRASAQPLDGAGRAV